LKHKERVIMFNCAGERLLGILTEPTTARSLGVVIVVGGAQYRVGSHRQFTLLARHLAAEGYPVFRFDQRGLGDSTGTARPVEEINEELPEIMDDIGRAVDTFVANSPAVRSIVLWGICGAASAAMVYGPKDARVAGLVMLNPWARGVKTYARTQLRHYYIGRLFSKSFWQKVFSARLRLTDSIRSLTNAVGSAARSAPEVSDFRQDMVKGLEVFRGRSLFILSGRDLTAREFAQHTSDSARWQAVFSAPGVHRIEVLGADHTFSSQLWRDEVARATLSFLEPLSQLAQTAVAQD